MSSRQVSRGESREDALRALESLKRAWGAKDPGVVNLRWGFLSVSHLSFFSGRVKVNRLPFPTSLSTQILPP